MNLRTFAPLVASALLVAPAARAQTPPRTPPFTLSGYAEAFYQWNFNAPANGITHLRGFDNRHNSFTLANVALEARWDYRDLVGRVALQVGHTPSTYYLSEPALPGAPGSNASGAELWKYVQQAYVGYRFGVGRGLTVTAGLFLSPIGPESMPVREDWNWSRSNLFFGLPFYHTGLRASYPLTDRWTLTAAAYNGWNSVVDNNDEKSVSLAVTYEVTGRVTASALYFSGVERPAGAPEGRAWRHLLDAYVTWHVTPALSLLAHANAGFEPNAFGASAWVAGALYARLAVHRRVFVAVRADAFYESAASNGAGSAARIFWPVAWVASGTATLDLRPHEQVSIRLEYRHDHAAGPVYFGRSDAQDVPTRDAQDTVTAGMTTWF